GSAKVSANGEETGLVIVAGAGGGVGATAAAATARSSEVSTAGSSPVSAAAGATVPPRTTARVAAVVRAVRSGRGDADIDVLVCRPCGALPTEPTDHDVTRQPCADNPTARPGGSEPVRIGASVSVRAQGRAGARRATSRGRFDGRLSRS